MKDLPGSGLRVLYAHESYPHLTHTYILTEIEAMRRFGVHVEVWSSRKPFAPFATDTPIHSGRLQDAIALVKPDLVHIHWTHLVSRFRDDVVRAGLPITVRAHHPHDVRPRITAALQSDPAVRSIYMFGCFARQLPPKFTKFIPVDACFNPELYFPDANKDPHLVVRATPARRVKELELFIRAATRCPDHRFVLAAGTTAERGCIERVKDLNKAYGEPVDLRIDVAHEEIAAVMRRAGTYIYTMSPSEDYSMPISVSEALGAGCRVLNRAGENARLHLGGAGVLYHDEDEVVQLIKDSLHWSESQWNREKVKALVRAEELASPRVLQPILDDWLSIAESATRPQRMSKFRRFFLQKAWWRRGASK